MFKKMNIIILVLCFVFISACSSNVTNNTNQSSDDATDNQETTYAEYEIPDEFFNTNISKNDDGTYYFFCGRYLHYLDTDNNIKSICDRWYEDKYYLYSSYYYHNYLYCTAFNYDKEDANYGWCVGRLDIVNDEFEYLFYLETNLNRIYINDDYIYLYNYESNDTKTRKYALNDYTTYDECNYSLNDRTDFYSNIYTDISGLVFHVYNNILYVRERITTTDETKICLVQYNPSTTEKTVVSDYVQGDSIDFLDEKWFLFHSDEDDSIITITLTAYNLDFSETIVVCNFESYRSDFINFAEI